MNNSNNPNKVYIDCFYYGFYIDKEELDKYDFSIKPKKNVKEDIQNLDINKLIIKDSNNKKNNRGANKNNRKTIYSYDYGFSNIFNVLSTISLYNFYLIIEKLSNDTYMVRTNKFIVHLNDEYLTIY